MRRKPPSSCWPAASGRAEDRRPRRQWTSRTRTDSRAGVSGRALRRERGRRGGSRTSAPFGPSAVGKHGTASETPVTSRARMTARLPGPVTPRSSTSRRAASRAAVTIMASLLDRARGLPISGAQVVAREGTDLREAPRLGAGPQEHRAEPLTSARPDEGAISARRGSPRAPRRSRRSRRRGRAGCRRGPRTAGDRSRFAAR